MYAIDIKEMIDYRCDAVRFDEDGKEIGEAAGEIDHYGSTWSVMGRRWNQDIVRYPGDDHFNVVEMNKLAPEVVVNKDISTESGTYRISTQEGGTRMLTLALPKQHPLHDIDERITHLSVGVMELDTGDTRTVKSLSLIAHGENQTYDIDHITGKDYFWSINSGKPFEMYRDRALGVRLMVGPVGQDVDDATFESSVDIAVVPYVIDENPLGVQPGGSTLKSIE